MLVHGIAGIGKSTLVANWLDTVQERSATLGVLVPCQPWDTVTGLAVSLLHRFGIDDQHDPYDLMSTLRCNPVLNSTSTCGDGVCWPTSRTPGPSATDSNQLDVVLLRIGWWSSTMRTTSRLKAKRSTAPCFPGRKTPVRLLFISRRTMQFYDQRDVHTRDVIRELPLEGLPWTW